MTFTPISRRITLAIILIVSLQESLQAQQILERRITIDMRQKPLLQVFKQMEKAGNFTFSYNSNLIPKDSLATVKGDDITLGDVLELLFHHKYEFTENKNFLVITPPLRALKIITTDVMSDQQSYSISGLVVDALSGERLMNASVYEKELLVAAMTDEHGYFKLKFKTGQAREITLTASKLLFKDASINYLQSVAITDRVRAADYQHAAENSRGIEKEGLGRFLIGAKQRIQSLNIPDFFANREFQVSLTPGLSTRGMMSPQVVNKFSFNLLGGYTAGVEGAEIGGVFNINRFDSRYFQFSGVFNLVGGTVNGVQLAGVSNKTLGDVKGAQMAGYINKTEGTVTGVQFATLNNETRMLRGLQIGLVNVADTSYGASIGLLNISRNGFYKIGLFASDVMNTNVSFTSGTHRFYTTVHAGMNVGQGERTVGLGLSIGHDFMFSDRLYLSAIAGYHRFGVQSLRENWKQGKLLMNAQLTKNISVFAGPTVRRYSQHSQLNFTPEAPDEYGYSNYSITVTTHKNKFGWEAGLAFNSVFKPISRTTHTSENWFLGMDVLAGTELNAQKQLYGGEISVLREFNDRFAASLTTGVIFHEQEAAYKQPYTSDMWYLSYYDYKTLIGMPLKLGIRTYTSKHLFFAGEMGMLVGLNKPTEFVEVHKDQSETRFKVDDKSSSMIVSASAGYVLGGGLETSLKYDSYFSLNMQLVTLRLGYKIKLSK